MSSEVESRKDDEEDLSSGLLLRDIEEISKALALHKSAHKAFNSSYDHCPTVVAKTDISESKSNVIIQDSSHKDKKSSIWNWKPLKALTHIRNHRFNCCFFLHVHAIEWLPPNFNNLDLCVTWKHKADMLRTCPARVCLGMAEFEETLMHQCTIYGSRTRLHGSAKYEPKLFLLHTSVIGSSVLDIGNHWIDLSGLLPVTLDELGGDKRSSGKWTTSFKLTGKAKGAVLNVSFGFSILDSNSSESGHFVKLPDSVREGGLNHFADFDRYSRTSQLHNLVSVPSISTEGSFHHSQSANVKFLEEIFPTQGSRLSRSVTLLYQKLDERKVDNMVESDLYHKHIEFLKPKSDLSPESAGGKSGHEFNDTKFDIIEQAVEVPINNQMKTERCGSSQRLDNSVIETIDVAEIFKGEDIAFDQYVEWNSKLDTSNHDKRECATDDPGHGDNGMCIVEPAFEELGSAFYDTLTSKLADLDSLLELSEYYEKENNMKLKSRYKAERSVKSLSLDDIAESIENDFLSLLSIDPSQDDIVSGSGPELARDLLSQFEEEILVWGNPILDTDLMAEHKGSSCFTPSCYEKVAFADDFDLSFAIQVVERKQGSANQSLRSRRNAEMLENMETEVLMHEWGLNEMAFQYSPRASSGGFGSPVYLPAEEPLKLPPIEDGMGPIVWTRDGFLRSMNPLLFRNASNGARLIVQVSAPVVFPAAMGFTIMEILQSWASGGVEKMCIQANELMPLEDITGKTIQQVLSEAESRSDASKRLALQREYVVGFELSAEKKAEYLPFFRSSDTLYSCSNSEQRELGFVSFEDLVPMAITNIEGLLVEGLKIQSGMPDQEAPSSIRINLAGNSASLGRTAELSGNFRSEKASGLQVLDVDELVKYSLSLEEWMKLDSGDFDVEDDNDGNVMKLFAAHYVKPIELGSEQPTREDETVKQSVRNCGVFGNNFRMGLKVQLRDPLRNYEMVGSSMLALIEVNRVYSAPQSEMHCLSLEKICNREENGLDEHMILEGIDFEQNQKKSYEPLFKVSEVHLAGLNVLHGYKWLWGTSRQKQSGSRWLLSSGMARSNKDLISNSRKVIQSSSGLMRNAWPGDVLWSISFPVQGEAATWDEQVALNVHVRNPDIIFPTESIK